MYVVEKRLRNRVDHGSNSSGRRRALHIRVREDNEVSKRRFMSASICPRRVLFRFFRLLFKGQADDQSGKLGGRGRRLEKALMAADTA